MKLTRVGTLLYMQYNAGGFDVSHCPNAWKLAETIERAVNNHDALVAALRRIADGGYNGPEMKLIAAAAIADLEVEP